MAGKSFFFAGGGTGGHIYPAIAVAEKIVELNPEAVIHFFVSDNDFDAQILEQAGFKYTQLVACGFSARLDKMIRFVKLFLKSSEIVCEKIYDAENPCMIGVGGFVAAPACWAAHKLKVPVKILNVDIVPGRANKIVSRVADEIFVQFEDTVDFFRKGRAKVSVVGCPLRSGFDRPNPEKAIERFGLDGDKKILLITGASSGAKNINDCICSLLPWLATFADRWQVVHLAGRRHFEQVKKAYSGAKIGHVVLDYCDCMADLLAAADLGIGRSGAVSVAEYAAAGLAMICMPYPYHKDMHQYLNAGKLVEAGAAIIVDDLPDAVERKEWLAEELGELLNDDERLKEMGQNCKVVAKRDAAEQIARAFCGC